MALVVIRGDGHTEGVVALELADGSAAGIYIPQIQTIAVIIIVRIHTFVLVVDTQERKCVRR